MLTKYFIFILPVLFSILPIYISIKNYEIHHLNGQVGLYYNNIGKAKISNSKFTLLTHLNISFYQNQLISLQNIYSRSINMCSDIENSSFDSIGMFHCKDTFKILKIRLEKIQEKSTSVMEITGHDINNTRSKRGIFDGASYAFNWLFGIPDAEDAKFYDNSIKALLQDNRATQSLMKQQISVISSTIRNFNTTVHNFKISEESLNANIKLFNTFSLQTTNSLKDVKVKQIISSHIALLSQFLDETDEKFDVLITSITLAKHGILHPYVITPKTLLEELSKINLKSGLLLPFPLSFSTIYKYFEISELNVVHTNQLIIFSIKIPLVEENDYDLFNVIPLPISHNISNLYSYIEPEFPFLMMSTSKVYYVQMRDLSNCLRVTEEEYICHRTYITRVLEQPRCEVMLFSSIVNQIPKDCKTNTVKADFEIWHPLSKNAWIFVVSNPLQLTLTCDRGPIEDIKIESTGVIHLDQGCKGYTQTTVLESTISLKTNISQKIPNYSIVLDDCCLSKQKSLNVTPIQLHPIKISNIKLDELKYASHQLGKLSQRLDEEMKKPFIVQYSHWYTTALSLIGSILGIILLFNCLKWCGIFKLFSSYLCFAKSPKNASDSCCIKLFNTNINTTPITRAQLSQIIEEEERARIEERPIHVDNIIAVEPPTRKTGYSDTTSRRFIRSPSVNMR